VPRLKIGPIGLALTAYDIYRRLPSRQRKQVRDLAFKHGPQIAAKALAAYNAQRRRRR
jgi:hypothetical protein